MKHSNNWTGVLRQEQTRRTIEYWHKRTTELESRLEQLEKKLSNYEKIEYRIGYLEALLNVKGK